jgi:response regulator of citrate/malate metabolism
MVRCIIVDDDPIARRTSEHCVEKTSFLQLVKSCSNVQEALSVLHD